MSDIDTAHTYLNPYLSQSGLGVANPLHGAEKLPPEKVEQARLLERNIATPPDTTETIGISVKQKLQMAQDMDKNPVYWTNGGMMVSAKLPCLLTCIMAAHLCCYALSQAPKFGRSIEVVELKKGKDNHYILVAGRTVGDINGDLNDWNKDAFVIDLWGALQELGKLISCPPEIIVKDMADSQVYKRRTVTTIPPWGK